MSKAPPITIDTAMVYGKQAAATLKAIKEVDPADPQSMFTFANDTAMAIADALGVEVDLAGNAGGITKAASYVIEKVTTALHNWIDDKAQESANDRDDAQEAIMRALVSKYGVRSPWMIELRPADFADGGTYEKIGATGVPGILTGSEEFALPTDRRAGCYRRNSVKKGEGKSPTGVWRFWPGMYPLIRNLDQLMFINGTDFQSRYAIKALLNLAGRPFDPANNLKVDGRQVAEMLARFHEWAAPLLVGLPLASRGMYDPPMGNDYVPNAPAGMSGFNTFVEDDGTLTVHNLKAEVAPSFTLPTKIIDNSTRALEPAAYNYVVRTCARFFALREHLLHQARAWNDGQLAAAKSSEDPTVRAMLKARQDGVAPPLPKGANARHETKNVPAPRPGAVKKTPVRVGRPTTPSSVKRVGRPSWPADLPPFEEMDRAFMALKE